MPRRTKIIFITVFIIVGALMLSWYFYATSKNKSAIGNPEAPTYNPFNPFSGGTPATEPITNGTDTDPGPSTTTGFGATGTTEASRFSKITNFAIAGAVFFEDIRELPQAEVVPSTPPTKAPAKKPQAPRFETVPSLRYVERVTGHVYQMYLDTKVASKISNSTIPGIYEAIWNGKAGTVIYRYLAEDDKTISSFMATLGGTKGEFLPVNIIDISLSPDKNRFFYLTKVSDGVVGTTKSFEDTKTSDIFNSSFSEWLSQWVTNGKIYLTTKASASFEGSLFSLNTATGSLSKVFGGVTGLTTLASPDGSLVLYSSSTGTGPKLGVLNAANHTTKDTNTYGLPEKCVWGTDNIHVYCAIPSNFSGGDYPDSWYQGRTSFNDRFLKINTVANEVSQIADSNSGLPVDGTHLFLSKDESQLFFINKKDSTLWSLSLK